MQHNNQNNKPKISFWGTSSFSIGVLEALKENGIIPDLIVTAPDKPRGRKLIITSPPVKIWAQQNKVPFIQSETLDDSFCSTLHALDSTLFIVASYGKIIPQAILNIPKHGTLNVHPSLLPKLRGASPIQSAILGEDKTGVTIMLLDDKMDHGPIVAQKEVSVTPWPPRASVLEPILAHEGGKLLAEIIPDWISKKIIAQEQEHNKATYSKKFSKEDGLIDLTSDPIGNFRKIQAFDVWPKAYFFTERYGKQIRVAVTDAELVDLPAATSPAQAGEKLVIKKVLPEGKKEMNYADFLRGI